MIRILIEIQTPDCCREGHDHSDAGCLTNSWVVCSLGFRVLDGIVPSIE